jgi:hypothetical protein
LHLVGDLFELNVELWCQKVKERYQRVLMDNRNTHSNTSSRWEKVKHGVPQSSSLGPSFLLFYMNELFKITTKNDKLLLYADDSRVKVLTSPSPKEFKINMNKLFRE